MSTITLVRHGQAQTDARDEIGYDSLSDLGRTQSAWLGEHVGITGEHFERVYCGTLLRHLQTAEEMGFDAPDRDARLNEFAFFTLAQLWDAQGGDAMPVTREDFVHYMPALLAAWQAGRIEGAPESFADFEGRITDALGDIGAGRGPALVVTSGGLIGMAVRIVMGLDMRSYARTALTIMNTSVHRLHPIGGGLALTQFNAVPHLERPDRRHAQTHL